jgi:hypothetical protein
MNNSENITLPRNLTGLVVVDSLKPEFKGNYSYVYRVKFEGQLVFGFPCRSYSDIHRIRV